MCVCVCHFFELSLWCYALSTDKLYTGFEGSTTPHFLSLFTPEVKDKLKTPKHLIELPISMNVEGD